MSSYVCRRSPVESEEFSVLRFIEIPKISTENGIIEKKGVLISDEESGSTPLVLPQGCRRVGGCKFIGEI